MTVYQGARPRPASLGRRRPLSRPARSGRREHPVGMLMAAVAVLFVLGVVYLGQTARLAAMSYEVDSLVLQRDDLSRQVQTLEATVARWGSEPLVLDWAQQAGLDVLGAKVRVPARASLSGRTDRRLRHLGLLAVFVCLALALSVRLAYWQVAQGDDLRQRATTQMSRPALEFVQRGDITDRRGTLLATTAYRDLLAAYPDLIAADQRSAVARRLATLLEFEPPQTAKLVETFEKGVPYTIVKRRLTAEQSQLVRDALAAGDVAALSLEPQPVRFYPTLGGAPRTTLASQLLGFVTEDGEGRYGIEQHNHALLAGLDGGTAALEGGPPAGGGTGQQLRLTIDASLQLRIEKELYAIWVANKAERVSAVVMDPRTGQILAWASVPGYDANSYAETARADPGRFVDPLASQIYEPGSVMKMVTAAAALEAGVVRPGSILEDERFLDFGDFKVRNADKRSMGELTFAEVLAYSRNVPTAKVAARLGRDTASASAVLYDMWRRLGLNRASGVEVSSESRGIAADPAIRRWAPVDLANRSFGQGVAVTPVQLAVAFSTMVNGGRHMPCLLYTSPSPRDLSTSRMPSSA